MSHAGNLAAARKLMWVARRGMAALRQAGECGIFTRQPNEA